MIVQNKKIKKWEVLQHSLKIFNYVCTTADEYSEDWVNINLKIFVESTAMPDFVYESKVLTSLSESVSVPFFLKGIREYLIEYLKETNKVKKVNRFDILVENKELVTIDESWDQSIQDKFESYLPKLKKGTIKAWYLS